MLWHRNHMYMASGNNNFQLDATMHQKKETLLLHLLSNACFCFLCENMQNVKCLTVVCCVNIHRKIIEATMCVCKQHVISPSVGIGNCHPQLHQYKGNGIFVSKTIKTTTTKKKFKDK